MGSKLRCKAQTKKGTRCRRVPSDSSIYCKQHEKTSKDEAFATNIEISSAIVDIETQESGSEPTENSNEFQLRETIVCDHLEVCYNEMHNRCVNGLKMGVKNDGCHSANNENIGNMTQQTSNHVSSVYEHTGHITIANYHFTTQNFISHFGPMLLSQAELVESLTDNDKCLPGGFPDSSDPAVEEEGTILNLPLSRLASQLDADKPYLDHTDTEQTDAEQSDAEDTGVEETDTEETDVEQIPDFKSAAEKQKAVLNGTALRLAKISTLLRRAAEICKDTTWEELLEKARFSVAAAKDDGNSRDKQ